MSNVAGRTLSVGALCTGDNGYIKSKSSGIRGSPYSLVQAFPDDKYNQTIDVRPIKTNHQCHWWLSVFIKLRKINQREWIRTSTEVCALRAHLPPPRHRRSDARITEPQTRKPTYRCEISTNDAWMVKHEEEMRLFLSVRDGSDTKKVHLQPETSDFHTRPGVEI